VSPVPKCPICGSDGVLDPIGPGSALLDCRCTMCGWYYTSSPTEWALQTASCDFDLWAAEELMRFPELDVKTLLERLYGVIGVWLEQEALRQRAERE